MARGRGEEESAAAWQQLEAESGTKRTHCSSAGLTNRKWASLSCGGAGGALFGCRYAGRQFHELCGGENLGVLRAEAAPPHKARHRRCSPTATSASPPSIFVARHRRDCSGARARKLNDPCLSSGLMLFYSLLLLIYCSFLLVAICPSNAEMATTRTTSTSTTSSASLYLAQVLLTQATLASSALFQVVSAVPYANSGPKTNVKIGVLLEESDHEQANMFIRTIKMINEQKDETISRLLGMFAASGRRRAGSSEEEEQGGGEGVGGSGASGSAVRLAAMQTPSGGGRRLPPQAQATNQAAPSSSSGELAGVEEQPIGSGASGDAAPAPAAAAAFQGRAPQQRLAKHEYRNTESISTTGAGAGGNRTASSADRQQKQAPSPFSSIFGIFSTQTQAKQEVSQGSSGGADSLRVNSARHNIIADNNEQQQRRQAFDIRLEPMIEFLADRQSALEADEKVCQLIGSGVRAIMGPSDGASIQHVQSICDNLEIPYFELRSFLGGSLSAPLLATGTMAATTKSTTMPNGAARPQPLVAPRRIFERDQEGTSPLSSAANVGHLQVTKPNRRRPRWAAGEDGAVQAEYECDPSGADLCGTAGATARHNSGPHRPDNGATLGGLEGLGNDDSSGSYSRGGGATRRRTTLSGGRLVERKEHEQEGEADRSGAQQEHERGDANDNNGNSNATELTTATQGPAFEQIHRDEQLRRQHQQLSNPIRVTRFTKGSAADMLSSSFPSSNAQDFSDSEVQHEDVENDQKQEDDDVQLPPISDPTTAMSKAMGSQPSADSTPARSAQSIAGKPSSPPPPPQPQQGTRANPNGDRGEDNRDHFDTSAYDNRVPMQPMVPQTTPANKLDDITLNLYPPSHLLNSAYIDLIYALNWTSFVVVYEDSSSMIKLQDLFRESSGSSWTNKWRIKLFRIFDSINDYHQSSDSLAKSDNHGRSVNNVVNTSKQNGDLTRDLVGGERRSEGGTHATSAAGAATTPLRARRQAAPAAKVTEVVDASAGLLSEAAVGGKQNSGHGERANGIIGEPTLLNDAPSNNQQVKRAKQGSFRDVFWRVKLSGERNVLLDVRTENLYEALKQAQQVGCMTEDYSYLITSLDLHMIDLDDFKYSRTKITGFSIIQVAKSQQSTLRTTRNDDEALNGPFFDERYLENLGVHVAAVQQQQPPDNFGGYYASNAKLTKAKTGKGGGRSRVKNVISGLASGASNRSQASSDNRFYSNYIAEAENNDQTRREMLQSSPASLSLLPTVDRNNEQRLFDFFIEQQERNLSRVRISTSSAILHDSLMLYTLALNELDPNGSLVLNGESKITCSPESQPWPHGSSLVNFMRQTSFNGLSGSISFDQRGLRTEFKLDVVGMAPNLRLIKVGEWHSRRALEARYKFAHSSHQERQLQQQQSSGPDGVAPSADTQSTEDARSYDELAQRYENELRRYVRMLADGERVDVPYTRAASPNGALLVNDIIFERLYREQADKVDTLIVTAKLSQPYFMLKETPNKLNGNDQYEGYAVDLIHELSKLVNFKYKWREVADKKYGSKEVLPNGTVVWNGMIGEIVRGQADLAIVDLTITTQRQEAVDFTLPFMNTGISILFKKPTTKVTTLFSFLSPFSSDVWAYVLAAYCGISAILFLVGHLSPYEWADPHPCGHLKSDEDLSFLENQFSLLNSFWFTIGSLMQQGSDLTPRSMSTRTIAGIWYFFTLIMISSYTANLAAFLTVEKVVYPIENVRDLSNQQEIKYGCVESGSTCLFFHDSQIDTYRKIDETMSRYKTYVRSNDEGQKRVGEGKFAFFMESTTIEYIIERNCNLTQIGGLIDSKGYGLATSKKSRHKRPYRTLLNEGILHLQETGMLHVLKNRWWKERRGGGTCTDDGKGGGVTELSLANVGGVFVVLLGGLGISFLVAIAEFMWAAKRRGSTRDRMCEEMMNDLKFALACKSSTKPTNRKRDNESRPHGGSGARSLQRQELSILTQYSQDGYDLADSQLMLNANQQQHLSKTKECDPILLHAMLTMLMQQQQNQQRQQLVPVTTADVASNEPFVGSLDVGDSVPASRRPAVLAASGSGPMAQAARQSYKHARQQLPNGLCINQRRSDMTQHGATVDESSGKMLDNMDLDEVGAYEDLHSGIVGIPRQQQLVNWPGQGSSSIKQSDSSRRRTLHAQRTIDMTD